MSNRYLQIITFGVFFTLITTPSFAQSSDYDIQIPLGANEPGCEKTNECFLPYEIKISVGESITWINNDDSPHTVTAGDLKKDINRIGIEYPNGFSSPLLKSGDSWSHTFNEPGIYPYFSMVGLWMTGIITVEGEPIEKPSTQSEPMMETKTKPTIQEAYIFLDELPPMTINQGEPIFITGELITPEGNPISGKKISVETMDINGESFISTTTTDEDGFFLTEAYFFSSGESFAAASFKGDEEYSKAESSILIDVIITSTEVSTQTTQDQPLGFELPDIGGGGCLIATATFGSELSPQVQMLREIRDNTVLSTSSGTAFMTAFNSFYYSFSPTIADLERQNPLFKEAVKIVITPLLSTLSLLSYVDIDSEQEILGYGIGIILLNVGIYFGIPTVLILRFRKNHE